MPQQLIKVRPTKIEFIKLKRRLSLAERVEKLVKDRLTILTMEFLQIARETTEAKRDLLTRLSEAYRSLSLATGYHGNIALEKELIASEVELKIAAGVRNVAGMRIPTFELMTEQNLLPRYDLADTSSYLDYAARVFKETLKAIVELAELQRGLDLLGMEINRVKRVVNALDYIIIPGLKATISYLEMKFEENDREEKIRLKRVKVLLERR